MIPKNLLISGIASDSDRTRSARCSGTYGRHRSPLKLTSGSQNGKTLVISGKDLTDVTSLYSIGERTGSAGSRLGPCIWPGEKRETGGYSAGASGSAEDGRRVHQADQGIPAGSAHHHRTGGPHAGVRHGAFAPEIPGAHSG